MGIVYCCRNFAAHSDREIDVEIDALPCIAGMADVESRLERKFGLLQGRSAETSGGLLVCLPSVEAANAFCAELAELDKRPAWIIGRVVPGTRTARIMDSVTVIDV